MYKRYICYGKTHHEALLTGRINKLGYKKKIDKYDLTSRTTCVYIDNVDKHTASQMELLIIFAYLNSKNNNKSYDILLNTYGKETLETIFMNYRSDTSCIAFRENELEYRIIYFTK